MTLYQFAPYVSILYVSILFLSVSLSICLSLFIFVLCICLCVQAGMHGHMETTGGCRVSSSIALFFGPLRKSLLLSQEPAVSSLGYG